MKPTKHPRLQLQQQAVERLLALLGFLHPLSPEIQEWFRKHCVLRRHLKGSLLVATQGICEHYYFISSGMVRGYIQQEEKEITTWISVENELVTSIYSLHSQRPALENIQVLEDSWLLQLSVNEMEQLYGTFPAFNINGRILLQQYYRDAELRAYLARIPEAEAKYLFFKQAYPHLAERAPLKLIASYLSIRQETLSRIRRKLAAA